MSRRLQIIFKNHFPHFYFIFSRYVSNITKPPICSLLFFLYLKTIHFLKLFPLLQYFLNLFDGFCRTKNDKKATGILSQHITVIIMSYLHQSHIFLNSFFFKFLISFENFTSKSFPQRSLFCFLSR